MGDNNKYRPTGANSKMDLLTNAAILGAHWPLALALLHAADAIEVFQKTGRIGAAMISATKKKKTIVDWLVSRRMEFLGEAGAVDTSKIIDAVILEFDLCDAHAKEVCDYATKTIEGLYNE